MEADITSFTLTFTPTESYNLICMSVGGNPHRESIYILKQITTKQKKKKKPVGNIKRKQRVGGKQTTASGAQWPTMNHFKCALHAFIGFFVLGSNCTFSIDDMSFCLIAVMVSHHTGS